MKARSKKKQSKIDFKVHRKRGVIAKKDEKQQAKKRIINELSWM